MLKFGLLLIFTIWLNTNSVLCTHVRWKSHSFHQQSKTIQSNPLNIYSINTFIQSLVTTTEVEDREQHSCLFLCLHILVCLSFHWMLIQLKSVVVVYYPYSQWYAIIAPFLNSHCFLLFKVQIHIVSLYLYHDA